MVIKSHFGSVARLRGAIHFAMERSSPLSFARVCPWSTDNKCCLSESRQICHAVDGSRALRALQRDE